MSLRGNPTLEASKAEKTSLEQVDQIAWISVMKVFLYDGKTGLYYADCNRWADKPEEGYDFGNIENAIRASYQRGLSATEVVVISENPAGVIRLSMDSSLLGA